MWEKARSIVSNPAFLVAGTFITMTLLTSAVWYFAVYKPPRRKVEETLNLAYQEGDNLDKANKRLKDERGLSR